MDYSKDNKTEFNIEEQQNSTFICIDLKSFYASVECIERGLDPMVTNLVVADPERTDKTICLAITPAMKALGIKNRCRVFEIPKNVDYIMAPPRMQLYLDYSAEIYSVYLEYISKDDIHVYSIDECFMDVTHYLSLYKMTAEELGKRIMDDIFERTGVRATCGVGSNLYLTKIALDIMAKRSPNFIGVLDEESYREQLWKHKPITDFWRVGKGTAETLGKFGIHTMEDIAKTDEDFLYRTFGRDAELLIDHAWGRETATMYDIKHYKSEAHSLTRGQVLMRDYEYDEGRLIVVEMMDLLCLDMVAEDVVTDSVTLHIGYSNSLNVNPAHGTTSLPNKTSADVQWIPAIKTLYDKIVNPEWPIRRVHIYLNRVTKEDNSQYDFFEELYDKDKNRKMQKAVNSIKYKYGKNAIVKGMNLLEGGMTIERNRQIGGHKSGE